jgi:hypothetical protein
MKEISDSLATKTTAAYVNSQISSLINAAPTSLDTLKELATAINNDHNFNTTLNGMINNKLDRTSGGTI